MKFTKKVEAVPASVLEIFETEHLTNQNIISNFY